LSPEQVELALTEAGWSLQEEGGYSSHKYFIVGHDDEHTSITAHSWVWEKETHVFVLSDQRTERVYWVHAIPTPWQAKLLLEERGSLLKEEEVPTPSVPLAAGSSHSVSKSSHIGALNI
jgi:hypothetical protein